MEIKKLEGPYKPPKELPPRIPDPFKLKEKNKQSPPKVTHLYDEDTNATISVQGQERLKEHQEEK